MKLIALAVVLVGCDVPPPALHLRFAGPPAQACKPSSDCATISLSCPSMMSIRIADPNDTTAPYLSQCTQVEPDKKLDACALAHVKLDPVALPVRPLEVQIAVFPLVLDPMTQQPTCPAKVDYDRVWGFPAMQAGAPAFGGRAFYQPGDSEVVVTLGCTDPLLLSNAACAAPPRIAITASVQDFETINFAVGTNIDLHVFAGKPTSSGSEEVLTTTNTSELTRRLQGSMPSWFGDVDLVFTDYICLEALENVPQATSTLSCTAATTATKSFDLHGVYLSKTALAEILGALGMSAFPDAGLTIGIVVDDAGNPLDAHTVSVQPPHSEPATLRYLSNDRKSVIAGTLTSKSGVFVSTDAPFGTVFSTSEFGHEAYSAVGGLVSGHVTLVVLQRNPGSTM